MLLQKIFKAGNSNVIAVPKSFARQGQKVFVEEISGGDALIIRKAETKSPKKFSDKDFEKWLAVFLEENGEMIDELAIR